MSPTNTVFIKGKKREFPLNSVGLNMNSLEFGRGRKKRREAELPIMIWFMPMKFLAMWIFWRQKGRNSHWGNYFVSSWRLNICFLLIILFSYLGFLCAVSYINYSDPGQYNLCVFTKRRFWDLSQVNLMTHSHFASIWSLIYNPTNQAGFAQLNK